MKQVAPTDLAVIVQGETGTGKTYVAHAIHELSRRAAMAFVRVDVSVIPPSLAESELFGARKGAYTGSDRDRVGYVAGANGGTLFLDDIENIPLEIQAKLLDVLETKRVCPVGGGEPLALDFRVVAATNRDLHECVAAKTFREDLLYRLGEFVIDIPPLRERPEDILFFMDVFLLEACTEMGRQVRGFSAAAADLLLRHPWPGNVRELKNVVRRAALLATGDLVETGQIDFIARGDEAAPGRAAGALAEGGGPRVREEDHPPGAGEDRRQQDPGGGTAQDELPEPAEQGEGVRSRRVAVGSQGRRQRRHRAPQPVGHRAQQFRLLDRDGGVREGHLGQGAEDPLFHLRGGLAHAVQRLPDRLGATRFHAQDLRPAIAEEFPGAQVVGPANRPLLVG